MVTHHKATERHLPYGITQCYLTRHRYTTKPLNAQENAQLHYARPWQTELLWTSNASGTAQDKYCTAREQNQYYKTNELHA